MARMAIPAIGLDTYVLNGLTFQPAVWSALLRRGPAHLAGSALPGAPGNVVILGHVNIWGSVFLHLRELRPGDPITLQTAGGTFTYRVTGSLVVAPSDVAAIAPHAGPATLELATCTGPFDTQRLIVVAALTAQPPPLASSGGGLLGAENVVLRFEGDLAAGRWTEAAALLSPALRAQLGAADLAAQGAPVRAAVQEAWTRGSGGVEVLARLQLPEAGARATVGFVVSGGAIRSIRPVGSAPLVRVPPVTLAAPADAASGQILCGPDRVAWSVGPVGTAADDGFRFQQRASALQLSDAAGRALPGVEVPGLAMGTVPVACGDLLGDGGDELVVRTALGEPGVAQVAVYRLDAAGAELIGEMEGSSLAAGPDLVRTAPLGPYAIGIPQPGGGTAWWRPVAGRYEPGPAPAAQASP
jgi:LPXTG-site transpeptidase (sortase) family protein